LLVLDNDEGVVEEQDPDDLGTVVTSYDLSDDVGDGVGLTMRGRSYFGALFVGDAAFTTNDVETFAPREIEATVRPGAVPDEEDLDGSVTPGSVPDEADLDATVSTGEDEELDATVTPRVDGTADLDSAVQPGSLAYTADLDSVVEVTAVPIEDDHASRVAGRVAPQIVVDEDDMAEISGEVGSALTVDPGGRGDELRRVVQLLDAEKRFPKARPSEATRLYRGDAVLYAHRGDAFAVGERVTYQGVDWRVAGFLGFEMVGDSRLYREVGLRRLATVHKARATGTVQRTGSMDVRSEVEVPEP